MNFSTVTILNKIIQQDKYKKYYKKMTLEEIAIINKELTNTLRVFDSICRKNRLTYMVVAGALIGAVRDKTCIPWDDDIDLVMPREDYYKFNEAFKASKYVKEYKMVYPEDNHVITMGAHFYRKDGKLPELIDGIIGESLIYEPYAYLDIVPLDSGKDCFIWDKCCGILVNIIQMGFISRRCFKEYDPFLDFLAQENKELKINLIIRRIFAIPFLLIPKSIIFKCLKGLLKYNTMSKFMTISYGAKRYFGEEMPREVWLPPINIELNGLKVMAPNKYKTYLKHRYGNFMTLPPLKEREERMIRLRSDWQNLVED